ncbi:MAG: NFACT family protein [Synergistes sp.]|nr:NFACT family protein [Synergistes sp.]
MSFGPELVWYWKKEIASAFCGKRVQRVDGGNNAVVISFGQDELLLSWDSVRCGAVAISQKERKELLSAAAQTPQIVNALRSHITGAVLFSAEQLRRDRILKLSFRKTVGAGFSVVRNVIFEPMERFSNLLLADESDVIIETAKHIHPADNSFRAVLPGLVYIMPPLFGGVSLEEWLERPEPSDLANIAGFGRKLLKAASGMPADICRRAMSAFYSEETEKERFIPQKLGNYITVFPELLPQAVPLGKGSGFAAVLEPMRDADLDARKKRAAALIGREITRRERQLSDIKALIHESLDGRFRQYGELITANLWRIKPGAGEVLLSGYDEDGNTYSLEVPLVKGVSPQKSAEVYFSKYKKIRASAERAAALMPSVEEELAGYAETLEAVRAVTDGKSLSMIEDELGIAKRAPKKKNSEKGASLPPHLRFEFDGAIVYAGLSAKGNRYVTFKLANPDDIWFHAQGVPGSHVILRVSVPMPEDELGGLMEFCASLALFYSRMKESTRSRVDHTKRKYVSPIRGGVANVTYKEFSSMTGDSTYWQEYLKRRGTAS